VAVPRQFMIFLCKLPSKSGEAKSSLCPKFVILVVSPVTVA
jgi:hypothetical protein